MPNGRNLCDEEGNEHMLVLPSAEVRDSLGTLAVHVLAARENIAQMEYEEMLSKLYEIVCGLHDAFDKERPRSMPL